VASNQVLDVCLSKGSRDNMTMILVVFDAAPKINEKAAEDERKWLLTVENKLREILDDPSQEAIDDPGNF
jgi:hypothetical protein